MRRFAVLVVALAAGIPIPSAGAEPALAFTRTRLLRAATIEKLIVEDLTGDGRPDILVQQSPGRELVLFVQKPDGTYPFKSDRRIALKDDVFAWTLARLGPPGEPPRVCAFTPEGVVAYPPVDARGEPLREVLLAPTFFTGTCRKAPMWCDLIRDWDGNGRADILLPQRDGLSVFLQTAPGRFTLNQQIPMDLAVTVPQWGSGLGRLLVSYRVPNAQSVDLLGRGHPQLLFTAQDTVTVHAADADGTFDAQSTTEFALRGRRPKRRFRFFQYSLPPAFTDLNGDGAADILHVIPGRGEVSLFLGTPGGKSEFPTAAKPRPPDDLKKIDGLIPFYWVRDVNGDGRPDLVLAVVEKLNIISGLQIFLTRQVDIQLLVFLGRSGIPGSPFAREPDFARTFTVPITLYWTRETMDMDLPFYPNLEGDFNKDGLKDLVIKRTPTVLAIYPGVREGVFGETPLAELPIDALYDKTTIHVADLNGDGRSDLVLHHVDWDTMFHDVELYISK